MPFEGHFYYDDGEVAGIPITEAGEIYFAGDFADGRMTRIISIECTMHDLGGVVHVNDDADILETFCTANTSTAFTPGTQVDIIPPGGSCSLEINTRSGRLANIVMQHTVPFTKSLN